jgi:DNA-binding beta-propeller fold protein YncE
MTTTTIRGATGISCALVIALLTGCGGAAPTLSSASSARAPARLDNRQSTRAQGNVAVSIKFRPKGTTALVTPKYVSASTQSLKIVTDGIPAVIVNLTPLSPNCSPDATADGAYICTARSTVPAGNHAFTVTTYDLPGAAGNVLSTNSTASIDVKPTGLTMVSLTLEGIVRFVILSLATTNPPVGVVADIGLTAMLEDADQNLIVGPAAYEHPVTLTTTDSKNGSLSKVRLNSPLDTADISVKYSGANVAQIVYSAAAADLPAANAIAVVLAPGSAARLLYVSNEITPYISVFDLADPAAAPAKIGVDNPEGIALDAAGKLYVANSREYCYNTEIHSILIFDTTRGNVELPAISVSGTGLLLGLALDGSGKLYAANNGDSNIRIFDTAHGNAVLPPITSAALSAPVGLAVDAAGKLYVANGDGRTLVFDTRNGNTLVTALPPTAAYVDLWGIAVGNGKLYVPDFYLNDVNVYDTENGYAPLPTIREGGVNNLTGAVVDANGRLYVADVNGDTVSVFDTAHGNAALPEIRGVTNPVFLALGTRQSTMPAGTGNVQRRPQYCGEAAAPGKDLIRAVPSTRRVPPK